MTKPATKAEKMALAEEAWTELAKRSLHQFIKQAWHVIEPEMIFSDNWHIKALCDHLEAVTDGRIENLLINVPPGTMKSLLVCVFWPAWVWTKKKGKRFMFSSYAENLSLRDSDRCRRLLASEWYQSRWPLRFSDSQDAKGKFENEQGGWRMVGSITGKGTGEHPDFNVADDPHNVLQAESDKERETVTKWAEAVFSTRGIARGVRKVMVMQRLHSQDASGVLLAKGGWVHICLPMRFDFDEVETDGHKETRPRMPVTPLGFQDPRTSLGQLLWPAVYTDKIVSSMEVAIGAYNSAGQLQQRPSPRGGGKFKRTWFEIMMVLPQLLKLVRYWDKAGTAGGTGARTATVLMATFVDNAVVATSPFRIKYIVLDAKGYRVEAAEREAIILQTAQTDALRWGFVENWVEQEPGSGGKESAQGTISNTPGFTFKPERVTGSKEVRCDPFASQASVGKCKILSGDWNGEFLDEIEAFPMGKLKDMVDAGGGAFNKLVAPSGSFSSGDAKGGVTSTNIGPMRQFVPRVFTPTRRF